MQDVIFMKNKKNKEKVPARDECHVTQKDPLDQSCDLQALQLQASYIKA